MSTTKKSPPLVDYDWYVFCLVLCKGIEGENWGEPYDAYKEMSRAVGVKKPQEAQEDNILERNKTRLALWEEHLKDPIVALDKALNCVENSY